MLACSTNCLFQWYLQQFGNEWTIKNMMTGDYLGLGPSGVVEASPLRASQTEFRWQFEKDVNDPQTWKYVVYYAHANKLLRKTPSRIRVANTNWFIDLASGSTDPGTVIFLWEGDPKNPNQRWKLQYHDASGQFTPSFSVRFDSNVLPLA